MNVAQMIVELIRDNRKIVDRITQEQIEMFVGLLRQNKVRGLGNFGWTRGSSTVVHVVCCTAG